MEDRTVPSTTEGLSLADPAVISDAAGGSLSELGATSSTDGRYVVFLSSAENIVPNDANGAQEVFVRDTLTNTTTLVSVNLAGAGAGNGPSDEATISADGRFVAFSSTASNLTADDVNSRRDVFVRDLVSQTTTLISRNSAGTAGGNSDSRLPAISADGQAVAFRSVASNLTSLSDTNATWDVFVRYWQAATPETRLVSVNSAGTASGNGDSDLPALSADGRTIAFRSAAANLIAGDFNNKNDVFSFRPSFTLHWQGDVSTNWSDAAN